MQYSINNLLFETNFSISRMHLECLDQENAESFSCITKDLQSFECVCTIITNDGLNTRIYTTYPNASYFKKWADENACVARRIFGSWINRDTPNVRQLFDYCNVENNNLLLHCYSSTYKDPDDALCKCSDPLRNIGFTGFKFAKWLVWADATKTLKNSCITHTSQNIDVTVNLFSYTDTSFQMTQNTIINSSLPDNTITITSNPRNINNTGQKPQYNTPHSLLSYDNNISTSILRDAKKNSNLFLESHSYIHLYWVLIAFPLICIVLCFLIRKFIEKIKNYKAKQFKISRGLKTQNIINL